MLAEKGEGMFLGLFESFTLGRLKFTKVKGLLYCVCKNNKALGSFKYLLAHKGKGIAPEIMVSGKPIS